MLFKRKELKTLKLFYLYQVLTASFAVVWIYMVVYLHKAGFSYTVISVGFGLWGIAMFVFEVPTGALADTLGRKPSTLIGLTGHALCMFCVPFVKSDFLFCVLITIWGTMVTMVSGAFEAWIVDHLKKRDREDLVKVYFTRAHVIMSLGFIVASLISGFTVKYFGMEALWYINSAAAFAGVILLLFQEEDFERKSISLGKGVIKSLENMKEGARFAVRNHNVFCVILATAILFMGMELTFINWRPYLLTTGIALENLAFLSTIGWILSAAIPFGITRALRMMKGEKYLLATSFTVHSVIMIALFFVVSPYPAAVVYVVSHTRMAFMTPVIEPYFQSMVPSSMRATVASFKAMVIGLAFALSDGLNALLADSIGVQKMMGIAGLIMLPAVLVFLRLKPSAEKVSEYESEVETEPEPLVAASADSIEDSIRLAADTAQA